MSGVLPLGLNGQEEKDKRYLYYNAIWHSNENNVALDSAIHFFEKLSHKYLKAKDTVTAVNILRNVTQGYFKKGALFESELSVVQTLKLLENRHLDSLGKEARKASYNYLGMIYRKVNDYESAIRQYNHLLQLSETLNDSITALNNLANIYSDVQEYKLAVDILNEAYKKTNSIKEYNYRWRILDNLGYNESKLDIPGALERMKEALKTSLEMNDKESIFSSYTHLMDYYMDKNNEDEALIYASKANEMASSLNLPLFRLESLRLNALSNRDSNVREFVRLSDSIIIANNLSTNKYISKKYDYEKQEKIANEAKLKLKDSQLENERQKNINLIYLFIGLSILLISVFTYFFLKSKHKKEKLQQVFDTESSISKKVHDDIANDVFQVMTTLQADNNLNQNIKGDIELIYDKARDISKQLGEIDLEGDYKEILNDLALRYNTEYTNIIIKDVSKIAWGKISRAKKTALYKILQELLINMKKYSKASVVVIAFNNKQKKTIINYSDDGVGCDLKKSNGLLNVENRIKAIGGTITFESRINNGFKAKIQM
ncbi:tetratricopeptide repeat protein [Winogradskyella sp.]|uniref:ATP-binding protein n=1 Tax=Winogradskyella sp. TaxID=1883156 RepID=UPI00261782F8|nr:tetratricopeptide repeat protein [Winogradskyella sp.]